MESLKKNQESGALKHGLKCHEILAKYHQYLANTIFHTDNWSTDFSPNFRQYHRCFDIYRHFGWFFRKSKILNLSIGQGAVKPFSPLVNTCAAKPLHIFCLSLQPRRIKLKSKCWGWKLATNRPSFLLLIYVQFKYVKVNY